VSYPELYTDERVVLQAQNVKVKSVSFEVVLTTRRLVLIDTKKGVILPQEINLATLKDVESGENAIRDPTITISIITISGNTRQMVLTFSKTSGGERRRECDEWVRALRQNITTTIYHPVTQAAPKEVEPEQVAQPPSPAPPRIEVTSTPPPKKRIEIARPMKKIVETAPAMPIPVETTSLPTGSFCNRCGNRIPSESAFCNRCGTPVAPDAGTGSLPAEEAAVPVQQPAAAVEQVQITALPVTPAAGEVKDRPIEEVIHSIEPLIEDSVPRTAPAPLVPSKHPTPPAETTESAVQVPPPAIGESAEAAAQPTGVQWPVLPKPEEPGAEAPPVPPVPPSAPASPPVPPRKSSFTMIAVLAIALLAVIAGVYIFMQDQAAAPEITPTPEITVPVTTIPQTTMETTVKPATTTQQETPPSFLIPASGVWVKVSYPNKFDGSVGTPGSMTDISDSGDHMYQIPTADGPVAVSIQKSDGTSAMLAIDIYKDGSLVKHAETTSPKGIIELQVPLKSVSNTTTTASG
jgi:hypothetical protein